MGLTVLADKPRPIETQDDRKRLHGHVVDNSVVGALEKRRVDRYNGANAARRKAGCKGDGVPLRDSDVEKSRRVYACESIRASTARHCRRDRDYPFILSRQLGEALSKHFRIRGLRGADLRWLSRRRLVPWRQGVPLFSRGMLAGWETLPLLRDDVHEARSRHSAHCLECRDHGSDVVAVDRTEVAKAQLLEQYARGQKRLYALLPFAYERPHRGERSRRTICDLADLVAYAIVQGISLDRREILRHRADIRCDRHLVVIEHDDEITLGMPRVVQALVREA